MRIETESYQIQAPRWPKSGRHILAQYDAETIVVYQAYRPSIGNFAAEHGYFGGEFSYSRMSWIKPNFLWMMYRSGWGTKEGQEVTLAVRIRRSAFDAILKDAVYSTYVADVYGDPIAWKKAVAGSDVRLQWDPDHSPAGGKLERRAIQLGLRGRTLAHLDGSGSSTSRTYRNSSRPSAFFSSEDRKARSSRLSRTFIRWLTRTWP